MKKKKKNKTYSSGSRVSKNLLTYTTKNKPYYLLDESLCRLLRIEIQETENPSAFIKTKNDEIKYLYNKQKELSEKLIKAPNEKIEKHWYTKEKMKELYLWHGHYIPDGYIWDKKTKEIIPIYNAKNYTSNIIPTYSPDEIKPEHYLMDAKNVYDLGLKNDGIAAFSRKDLGTLYPLYDLTKELKKFPLYKSNEELPNQYISKNELNQKGIDVKKHISEMDALYVTPYGYLYYRYIPLYYYERFESIRLRKLFNSRNKREK